MKCIETICDCSSNAFLNLSNVVGVGAGYKVTNGMETTIPAIIVMVSKKQDLNTLDPSDLVPTVYDGYPTDVIETGPIYANALTSKVRPVLFGYSVGPQGVNLAGTAGCLVKGICSSSDLYILSNNHVLAQTNALPIGTPILQPAKIDGGLITDVVASLASYTPINFSTPTSVPDNFIDAALAKVTSATLFTSRIALAGEVKGIVAPFVNQVVKKVGRTSELTTGKVTATNATVIVNYGAGLNATFKQQIVTTNMAAPGDSGSLLLDNNNRAVGLLFAGSSSATVYNNISTVLKTLSVGIVTSVGTIIP